MTSAYARKAYFSWATFLVLAFFDMCVNKERSASSLETHITRPAMFVAVFRIRANTNMLALAGQAGFAKFALVMLRVCAAFVRVETDIDLFTEALVASKTVWAGRVVLTCSRRCSDGVGDALISKTERSSFARVVDTAAVVRIGAEIHALTETVDTQMAWCTSVVCRPTDLRLCFDLNGHTFALFTPLAALAFLIATIVRIFAKAEASTLANYTNISRAAFLREIATLAGVDRDSDVRTE
jgi:hypothetical protein